VKNVAENRLTEEQIREALRDVIDYEIGIDVVSLGLIYDVKVDESNNVKVLMTLTTPMCPLGPMIMSDVERKVKELGANEVEVELTFDPPWSPEMMDPEIRKAMGI
jgi:metal-sulfur cluster biosynthetic enzyme